LKTKKQEKKLARMFLNHVGTKEAMGALEELAAMRTLVMKNRDFRGFMVGPQFSVNEKKSILSSLNGKLSFSDGTKKFLNYLIENDSMGIIDEIQEAAVSLYLERAKKAKATVIAPVDLEGDYLERLRGALKKVTERDVEIEFVKDPSVLGGVLVRVGSTMYDGSLKGQLKLLREELIKG
jgi:F-type H+-transporting ATPase subunit delta